MDKNDKIYIAGHRGMVGSAIMRNLIENGYTNLLYKTSSELDLTNQNAVNEFFEEHKPKYVFLAAAKVGGILSNSLYKVEFLYNNLMIQNNIIHAAANNEIEKLLFLGSSCIYPKNCSIPIKEEYLMTGELEESNNAYAIAKIAGLELCKAYKNQYGKNFISCMPTNLYGPGDNYDEKNSHVLPAMIRKFRFAKIYNCEKVEVWGSGAPLREFLHVDDMADACIFLMNNYNDTQHINVGYGSDISIRDLAYTVADIIGYTGEIVFNTEFPDGTYRKMMDSSKLLNMGWHPKISLKSGIKSTYEQYLTNI